MKKKKKKRITKFLPNICHTFLNCTVYFFLKGKEIEFYYTQICIMLISEKEGIS